eukprot:m.59369 g.59369  ORF g.59369 m.59369 type:complete len:422 (-) comp11767_c0_seq1:194-1459(-)
MAQSGSSTMALSTGRVEQRAQQTDGTKIEKSREKLTETINKIQQFDLAMYEPAQQQQIMRDLRSRVNALMLQARAALHFSNKRILDTVKHTLAVQTVSIEQVSQLQPEVLFVLYTYEAPEGDATSLVKKPYREDSRDGFYHVRRNLQAFASGSFRTAYRVSVNGNPDRFIMKTMSQRGDTLSVELQMQSDLVMLATARQLAKQFSDELRTRWKAPPQPEPVAGEDGEPFQPYFTQAPTVRYVDAYVGFSVPDACAFHKAKLGQFADAVRRNQPNQVQPPCSRTTSIRVFFEEFLGLCGFGKWNINSGNTNAMKMAKRKDFFRKGLDLANAFSHYTYAHTKRRYGEDKAFIVLDVQGTAKKDGLVLTDPAICNITPPTVNRDQADLGRESIVTFFHNHVCGHYCEVMGIKDERLDEPLAAEE